jgi:flagellar basal-body rod modification protein FlgD
MAVTSPTSTTPSSQTQQKTNTAQAAKSGFAALDGDAFLKLLIAQLKYQDPTKPVDPTQYVSQLAQFSGVEQAVKTNSLLDGLNTTTALSQAEGMIGRTVSNADGTIKGEIAAVKILSDGSIAVLKDGRELKLGNGVTVS